MRAMQAIAAMAKNRVIGNKQGIPWHLPEDFRWFKEKTMGHILLMGRKTFESIGRPLPGRETWILSRSNFTAANCRVFAAMDDLPPVADGKILWLCGGARLYQQFLPTCSDLYLTRVNRSVAGDACFPPFESMFSLVTIIKETPDFRIEHYRHCSNSNF